MKKSTYIDYAVIMAARSRKIKKKNKPVGNPFSLRVAERENSEKQQISSVLTTAMVLEVFTHGLTA